MTGALWYLASRSAANRLRRQAARLRQPRYLVVLLVGLLYLYAFLFGGSARRGMTDPRFLTTVTPVLGNLLLLLALLRWWVFGGSVRTLAYTPAEVDFLFPAPISRASLVRWKIARSQLVILFNAVLSVYLVRHAVPQIPLPCYALSLWILYSTLSLHRLGATLVRTGIQTHWQTGLKRNWLPLLVGIGMPLLIAGTLAGETRGLSELCCGIPFWESLGRILQRWPARLVTWPLGLLLAPLTAGSVARWTAALGPALGILALHVLWVVRSNIAFEEAAVHASAEWETRLARRRRGTARRTVRSTSRPFFLRLRPTGWPALAITWKNLLSLYRGTFSRSMLVGVLAVILAVTVSTRGAGHGWTALAGRGAIAGFGFLLLLGPVWVRADLREDLAHLATLRSFPLTGTAVVVAEMAAPVVVLTLMQIALLLVAGLTGAAWPVDAVPPEPAWLVLTLPALLGVNAIGITVQNAGALLFPEWVRFGPGRMSGGIETLGQNILTSVLTLLLSLAGLVLPLLGGLGTAFFLQSMGQLPGGTGVTQVMAALGFLVVAGTELWLLFRWLGRVYERMESFVPGTTG